MSHDAQVEAAQDRLLEHIVASINQAVAQRTFLAVLLADSFRTQRKESASGSGGHVLKLPIFRLAGGHQPCFISLLTSDVSLRF